MADTRSNALLISANIHFFPQVLKLLDANHIDPKTLTPRRYQLKDSTGVERFSLTLSRYALVGNVVWDIEPVFRIGCDSRRCDDQRRLLAFQPAERSGSRLR